MFVRSPDGALHRVVRHATTTETIAKLESIPSDYHLDCQCMLDNGEALTWIGDNRYRQVDGGKVYTAVRPQQAQGDARKQNPDAEPALDACRTQAGPAASPPPRTELPLAVINLKTGNDWSLIRAWREHLNISTADMAARLGVDHSIYIELERPRPRPRQIILERVSAALGYRPNSSTTRLLADTCIDVRWRDGFGAVAGNGPRMRGWKNARNSKKIDRRPGHRARRHAIPDRALRLGPRRLLGHGHLALRPRTHCVCRTSSGEKVAWLGGQTYQLLKSGTSLTAVDRRRG